MDWLDNLTRLLPSSGARVVLDFLLFVATGVCTNTDALSSTSSAWICCGSACTASPARGRAVAVSGVGVASDVRPDESDPEASAELRFSLVRRWADQRPCIERFNAFEPCLASCEPQSPDSENSRAPISPFHSYVSPCTSLATSSEVRLSIECYRRSGYSTGKVTKPGRKLGCIE